MKTWYARNKERANANSQRWEVQNKDRRRATKKSWRQRNPEKVKAWVKSWQERNPEKRRAGVKAWTQGNPEKRRAGIKSWATKNPHRIASKNAAYRAGLKAATPPWSDRKALDRIYKNAQEKTRRTGTQHHVDHRYPLKHRLFSGLHVPWNLQIITDRENREKRNRVSPEMLVTKP